MNDKKFLGDAIEKAKESVAKGGFPAGAVIVRNGEIIVFACSKEKVSEEYYGGHYHIMTINGQLIHPIQLVHIHELEQDSLSVVKEWEKVRGI